MSFRLEAISTMYLRSHTALPTALLDLKVMVILRASPCDGSQQEAVIAKNLEGNRTGSQVSVVVMWPRVLLSLRTGQCTRM